ncbi:MAG: 4-(cytidine 5'-diphospho)-2-C-methyl-D-erythritol kinase [Candidatus Omnitrophica bacterium]|nr:4-(cytidine 5'-diphospho)-2-C-methyl-D-erythritol kinase [Candidatus Omnitrophota bacterium]
MKILAPAKVNLYLEVIKKREDGFHEIETLFEKISLCDRLNINISETECIKSNDTNVPTGENSLLSNIIKAFKKKTNLNTEFNVYLEKNIPIAAGLGGGSSDAAALLKGINSLSGEALNKMQLASIASQYGADIPFFIYDESFAIGKGTGNEILPIHEHIKIEHILINPPFEVSTKEVYSKVSPFNLTKQKGTDKMFNAFLRKKDTANLAANLHNDLQAITLEKCPQLEAVLSSMEKAGAKGQLITGSGPTVFGIFDKEIIEEALILLSKEFKKEKGWRIFRAETYKESKEAK